MLFEEKRNYNKCDMHRKENEELKRECKYLQKRLRHLLQSDYIRKFDEWDSRKECYKLDIKDADKKEEKQIKKEDKKIEKYRLTRRNKIGKAYYPKCFEKCEGNGSSTKCDNCKVTEKVCEKLAKYEDIEEKCITQNGAGLEYLMDQNEGLVTLVAEII